MIAILHADKKWGIGKKNDLIDRIAADPAFGLTREEIEAQLKPENFIGRSVSQVSEFLENIVCPLLEKYDVSGIKAEITV